MVLNEFLKAHRKLEKQARINQQQETTIAHQQKEIEVLTASLKEQQQQIQKVSAELEASRSMPQLAVNNQ